MDWLPVALVVVLAMGFTYTNGFHDASNAVATSVSTRSLTPRIALGLAAVMNLLGGFAGVRVAQTIGGDIIEVPMGSTGVAICAGALIGATAWNLLTWWRGLPSSSSHALIGGLCGAALAGGATVKWDSILDSVVIPMVVSPILGLVGGFALMAAILWAFRRSAPGPTARGFRYAQTVSAAAMAFGHGMQDAAKTAGVVALTLVASGYRPPGDLAIPWWVIAMSAVVLSLGTYSGGWRIMRTLGRRIADVDPRTGSPPRRCRRRCSTSPRPRVPRSRRRTSSPRRSWASARPGPQGRALGRGALDRQRVAADLPGCRARGSSAFALLTLLY